MDQQIQNRILDDLAYRYPDGYLSFRVSGKRYCTAQVYKCAMGYHANINGFWHIYDHDGYFISNRGVSGRKVITDEERYQGKELVP